MRQRFYITVFLCITFFYCSSWAKQDNFPVLSGPYLGQKPPGMTPEVFAPEIVSLNNRFEFGIVVHPDKREIYFTSWLQNNTSNQSYVLEQKNGIWTEPRLIHSSSENNSQLSAVSPDGERFYFTSQKSNGEVDAVKDWNIWYAKKHKNKFGELQNPGSFVNTMEREQSPSLSKNGTIYYYSTHEGRPAVFHSKQENGKFKAREALPDEINSDEAHNPAIVPDESYLIFTSYRTGGHGDADLYISFKKPDGSWTHAKNMGEKINTKYQDDGAVVSPDGQYIFFASDRASKGFCDIYWVDAKITKELRLKTQE